MVLFSENRSYCTCMTNTQLANISLKQSYRFACRKGTASKLADNLPNVALRKFIRFQKLMASRLEIGIRETMRVERNPNPDRNSFDGWDTWSLWKKPPNSESLVGASIGDTIVRFDESKIKLMESPQKCPSLSACRSVVVSPMLGLLLRHWTYTLGIHFSWTALFTQ